MPVLVASTVMDAAASLNNDTAKTIYTYVVQIPYLNIALAELQEAFELNDVPVVDTFSAVMTVLAGTDHIGFDATAPDPSLPDDLIEPTVLWERQSGIDPYTGPMRRLNFLPRYQMGVEINQFIYYVWASQELRFLPANTDIDIRMDYIRNVFIPVTAEDDEFTVVNAQSYLQYKTAALLAKFVGENPERSNELNALAELAKDRVIGIGTKGNQTIMTRHRPFRAAFKRRQGW